MSQYHAAAGTGGAVRLVGLDGGVEDAHVQLQKWKGMEEKLREGWK
jgi:hypothetical protein